MGMRVMSLRSVVRAELAQRPKGGGPGLPVLKAVQFHGAVERRNTTMEQTIGVDVICFQAIDTLARASSPKSVRARMDASPP